MTCMPISASRSSACPNAATTWICRSRLPRGGMVPSGDGAMFVATVRTNYRVLPLSPTVRFACVSDTDEYRELLRDPSSTLVPHFQPKIGLDGASEQAFRRVGRPLLPPAST